MEPTMKEKCAVSMILVVSIFVAEMWANFAVIPAIYPLAPTTNLYNCSITNFVIDDRDYWNGKWRQLGSQSSYVLSARMRLANITCAKNTGCKPYRVYKPSKLACYSIDNGTCLELVVLHNDLAIMQRSDTYIL